MDICFLDLQELEIIHAHQINKYGGIHGIRDLGLLESAVNYPRAMFDEKYLHSDIYAMAAAYMYGIIKNHPFVDGNKRTGFTAGILFLMYNDLFLAAQEGELFDLAVATAVSNVAEADIALFFKQKTIAN